MAIRRADSVRSELAGSRSLAVGERNEAGNVANFKFRRPNLEGRKARSRGGRPSGENGVRRAAAATSGEGRDSPP